VLEADSGAARNSWPPAWRATEIQSFEMPSSDLIGIAILPAIIWFSIVFIARSTSGFASKLRASWRAGTKQELIKGARAWGIYALLTYLLVIVGVVAWIKIQGSNQLVLVLVPSHLARGVLLGMAMGLVLTGLLLILKSLFPQARKFSLLVMAGVESPPQVRISTLLLAVFAEELWRAVCLNSVLADGISGPQALMAVSIAYALTYMPWGAAAAISQGIVGAALAGLFLWSHSFLVPFTAHLILQVQVLLYAVAAAPETQPGAMNQKPFTKCPGCGTKLSLRQVNLNVEDAFFCPNCHARLTSSDGRRGFVRWGFSIVTTLILFSSWELFPELMKGTNYWVMLAVLPCAGIGLRAIVQLVFPPELEFGDPNFVGLNLKDQSAGRTEDEKGRRLEPDSK
jgi:hypothetical protein